MTALAQPDSIERAARIRSLAPELLGTVIGIRNALSGSLSPGGVLSLIASADRIINQAMGEV